MKSTATGCLYRSAMLVAMAVIVTVTLNRNTPAHEMDQTIRVIWPDLIPVAVGLEPEGIEMGKDTDFFVGGNSWTGNPANAGVICRGNLLTREGQVIVPPIKGEVK